MYVPEAQGGLPPGPHVLYVRGTRTSLGRWVRTGYRGHPGEKANPLFLQRPEWLRLATCFSAYGLCPFYLLIGATALLEAWVRMLPCLISQGEGDARSRRRCAR